jgi:tRNA threonylcarbamoyladenosine biosynthesis protein TsaB
MPSLRELSSHSPVVVLDAASTLVQVGIFRPDGTHHWQTSPDESGVAVFQCFEALGLAPAAVGSWVYCEGPGSILGVRTVAMALRTWGVLQQAPIFGYASLELVAEGIGRDDVAVIADARRGLWHHQQRGRTLRRLRTEDLKGELVMPDLFRHWAELPATVTRVPYLLSELWPKLWGVDLMRRVEGPDAFLHEEPSYVTWTPQIHRAPVP